LDEISDLIGAAERTEICLASLPGFNSPKQVRTQKKTDLIVSAAAHLLQERRFCHISMKDIARRANCAVTAIYARFDDKDALLPAVHLIILEQNRALMKQRISPEFYKDKSIDDFLIDFIDIQETFYKKNHNFIEAVVCGDSKYVFSQMASAVEEWAWACNEVVRHFLDHDPQETFHSLKFAINHINAIYRDRVITGEYSGLTSRRALAGLFSNILTAKLY
jgi:AcrR family transcriptional regulator